MKKSILILLISLPFFASAQTEKPVQDTTIQVTMNINQFRAVLATIDQGIDSKKVSKEIIEFLSKSAQMVQPADKPIKP